MVNCQKNRKTKNLQINLSFSPFSPIISCNDNLEKEQNLILKEKLAKDSF